MRKIPTLISLVLVLCLILVACGTATTTAATTAATTTAAVTTAAATTAAATTAAATTATPTTTSAAKIKIMFIPKNQGNPYFEAIITGFKKAATELGNVTFETTGPATADATSQIEYVTAAVQNGFNVIFIAANSNDALNPTFDAARKAGVKIVIINQDITGSETHRDASILPTNFDLVGSSQIECLGKIIDYKGEFAILSATTDAPDQNFWIEGMKKTVTTDAKYANMKLVGVVYGDDQPEKSTTEMEALLTKYPNIRGIIAPTTVGIAAAAKVVQTKKKAATVAVTGLGLPSQMKEFIKDGTVKQFQLWNPVNEGYLGAYFGVALAKGTVKAEANATFDAGTLGKFTIGKNAVIITGPPFTFDAANIDQFSF